jgi:hypothetical protein
MKDDRWIVSLWSLSIAKALVIWILQMWKVEGAFQSPSSIVFEMQ